MGSVDAMHVPMLHLDITNILMLTTVCGPVPANQEQANTMEIKAPKHAWLNAQPTLPIQREMELCIVMMCQESVCQNAQLQSHIGTKPRIYSMM